MDRMLGDGGMPLLADLGLQFVRYGDGWVEGTWTPAPLTRNTIGSVHGGVYAIVLDSAMNFATNSALSKGDRAATLDISYQIIRAAEVGSEHRFRADVVRAARAVAFLEASITSGEDLVARATATFSLRRKEG
jgi:uncharacterized protein (TIGR00369 family)